MMMMQSNEAEAGLVQGWQEAKRNPSEKGAMPLERGGDGAPGLL